jgi:hypothetical protein
MTDSILGIASFSRPTPNLISSTVISSKGDSGRAWFRSVDHQLAFPHLFIPKGFQLLAGDQRSAITGCRFMEIASRRDASNAFGGIPSGCNCFVT